MKNLLARDVMTPHVVTVAEDMPTHDLARFLIEHEISGAPVVDAQGRLVGVVSMTDIARSEAERDEEPNYPGFYRGDPYEFTLEDFGQKYIEQQSVTVREVMTPAIHSVPDVAPVAEVAAMMLDRHVHRLLVMHEADAVGIVTSLDLLRMVAGK